MKSSIAGFLTGLSINFGLILIGLDLVLLSLPWPFNLLATRLAILPHMQSISRGALDFQDLAYFLSLTTLFLILTIIKISTDKLKEDKLAKFKLNFVLALTIIAGVGLNILFQFFRLLNCHFYLNVDLFLLNLFLQPT